MLPHLGLLGAETAACSLPECDRPPRDLVQSRREGGGGIEGKLEAAGTGADSCTQRCEKGHTSDSFHGLLRREM